MLIKQNYNVMSTIISILPFSINIFDFKNEMKIKLSKFFKK